jgi:glycosyltransferase involved in cell wall biosynthesis
MDRRRIVLACNQLGIGGTEKAMVSLARALDRNRFDVAVVALHEEGLRRADLDAAGIPTTCVYGDLSALVDALAGADLVHVFRHGAAERLVPAACRQAGVELLVETNTFGARDASADERQFALHLFVSKMCALRYRQALGTQDHTFFLRHGVMRWPVEVSAMRAAAPERSEAKRQLGLDPERPVVVRTGRDNDRKWRNLLIDMLPGVLARRPDAQVVFVGVTPGKQRRLAQLGLKDRVRTLPLMDQDRLALVHAAADVYVNAAEIGESLSVVTVEAMAVGAPVVTCSTPWVDNAQIELVDNGVNGYVASHPRSFAEAIVKLLDDRELRERFGAAAAQKARDHYEVERQARLAERIYGALLAGRPVSEVLDPAPDEIDAFTDDYEQRLRNEFRPLTAAERREVRRERLRERGVWAARAVRHADRDTLKMAAWQLRSRLQALVGP